MYSGLVNAILLLDFWIKFIVGTGIITGILGIIWLCKLIAQYDKDEIKLYCRNLGSTLIFCCLCVGSIVIGNSKFMKADWIIIRTVAPILDKYVEEHPEAIYNPDTILSITNDTAVSIFQSIQTFPDILKRIANKETSSFNSEKEIDFEDYKRFKEWMNSR
jgi:hypothetical protein